MAGVAPTATGLYFFSWQRSQDLAAKNTEAFRAATRYPRTVIDDFLPFEMAEPIGKKSQGVQKIYWHFEGPGDTKHTGDSTGKRIATRDEKIFPRFIRHMMGQTQTVISCRFDRLTGFQQLTLYPNHAGCGLNPTGERRWAAFSVSPVSVGEDEWP
jgi:hypothetical protein